MRGFSVRKLVLIPLLIGASLGGIGTPRDAAAGQAALGEPVVYNLVTAPGDDVDRLLHQIYDPAFQVVDILDGESTYALPALREAPRPAVPVDEGMSIAGEVIVFFIISAEGTPTNPVIIRSTDVRLNAAILGALARWVFEPARMNGEKVAWTAGQRFVFHPGHPVLLRMKRMEPLSNPASPWAAPHALKGRQHGALVRPL